MRITFIFAITLLFSFQSIAQTIGFDNFITGLTRPVDMKHAGDERLFVVEQYGRIKVIDATGNVLGTDFLDIRSIVASPEDPIAGYKEELGLLGLAFHPNYATNGYFYVNYTKIATSGADPFTTVIARYQVSATDSNVADATSAFVVMEISQPYSNHNGGGMIFGPDGYLYIGTGDGGSGGDPGNRAQNGNSLLGKMLRIDVDGTAPYSIPADNPFVTNSSIADEIWAIGLRNPWRYSFDTETNDLWIADVGQNAREEVNVHLASENSGKNYGWRCYEGFIGYNTAGCNAAGTYDQPIFDYPHSNATGGFSITGGYIYRGCKYPGMVGSYIFIDYSSGNLWTIKSDGAGGYTNTFQSGAETSVVGFGQDVNGELYVLKLNGVIKKITETGTGEAVAPVVTESAGVLNTSSSGNLQWLLNGSPITGATTANYTALTSGTYSVVQTVGSCTFTSNSIMVTITAPDSDGDGLSDDYENNNGTDSNDPDSDDDNINDGDEVLVYFTDPNLQDTDGDGYNDDVEISFGSDPNDINDFPSSIKEVNNYKVLNITPNPAKNNISLQTPENGPALIKIYDYLGAEVLEVKSNNASIINLDVNRLNTGIYILVVEGQNKYQG